MGSREQRKVFEERGACANCGARPPIKYRKYCESCKQSMITAASRLHAHNRKIILDFYGCRCACCGESESMFLAVDHINNDGNIQRKCDKTGGSNFYRKLSKRIIEGNPPTDLQLLCHNCNFGKHRNHGICPHISKFI